MTTEEYLPKEIKELYEKASFAFDKKNYQYAIELLTQITRIKPDFAKGRQMLRAAEIKRFEEGRINIIMRLVYKISASLKAGVAVIMGLKGDRQSAIELCEAALRMDPKNSSILVQLGNMLKEEGLKESALAILESAINFSPHNTSAYRLLGELYTDLNDYNRARYCLRKVLELKPNDLQAEKGLKNIDALTTIDKSFQQKNGSDLRLRNIEE